MARNEEKKNATLNRWLQLKVADEKGIQLGGKRPYLASLAETLPEAERWRRDLVKEISAKVAEIQNAGLGEARLRDLNDSINKLFREKYHWDKRVKDLGGPDYSRAGGAAFDAEGRELPFSKGYRYFGAAKDLPGVRELFAAAAVKRPKRTRGQMFAAITPDYYGFRDEDDGSLVPAEAAAEEAARAAAVQAWSLEETKSKKARADLLASAGKHAVVVTAGEGSAPLRPSAPSAATDASLKAHVPVPSQQAIAKLVLERKKRMLMDRYATPDLQGAEATAKGLLNVGTK